jgi:hypothetical protein
MNYRTIYPSLPNLLIIGAHKCGTTSLHYYLSLHPQIGMSRRKEINFFSDNTVRSLGLSWYNSQFDVRKVVRGESSTQYTCFPEYGDPAAEIGQILPDARLIYLVRNPIERIISHYIYDTDMGWERRSFSEALTDMETSPYLLRSCYALQLESYYSHFPRKQILVIAAEDLRKHRQQTLKGVFRFLGVEENFLSGRFYLRMNTSLLKRTPTRATAHFPLPGAEHLKKHSMLIYAIADRLWRLPLSKSRPRPSLSREQHQKICSFLAPQVDRLRQLTGLSFDKWREWQ